jgi:hypothetical protein
VQRRSGNPKFQNPNPRETSNAKLQNPKGSQQISFWNLDLGKIKQADSTPLEVLHGFFVFLCGNEGLERPEVPPLPGLRVFLARI